MNELLRYWAFKLCGKGEQEDAASDVMTAAATEIERLHAENARLREALVYIGEVCIRHDQGNETGRVLGYIADNARAALNPDRQKARRAKALSELAEMDADLLDIDPEAPP